MTPCRVARAAEIGYRLVLACAVMLGLWVAGAAHAQNPAVQTVCTITVNSADEKASFARYLPAQRFRWVELVEPGRADWLASACRSATACDVLLISGHFDGSVFFSDRVGSQEHLPVAELERASCSESCPALFDRLKEVYLFGCNTLNPRATESASAELLRQLVREGGATADRLLTQGSEVGESSLQRMRRIFQGVPVIYGFPSVAPLGPVAGATLQSYFRDHGPVAVGSGRPNSALLDHFAGFGLRAVSGVAEQGADAEARRQMCVFSDDRANDAQRISAIHLVLRQPMNEVLPQIHRIQAHAAELRRRDRSSPAERQAWASLQEDLIARLHFLEFARSAASSGQRAGLLDLADDLGWLTSEERRREWDRLRRDLLSQPAPGLSDIDLACLRAEALAGDLPVQVSADGESLGHAAVRACLGQQGSRPQVLQRLSSGDPEAMLIAQAYLRQRPMRDPGEVLHVTQAVAQMPAADTQAQAIEILGRSAPLTRDMLAVLLQVYVTTGSGAVQNAVAGVLIRADVAGLPRADWLKALEGARLDEAAPLVDMLLRRWRQP